MSRIFYLQIFVMTLTLFLYISVTFLLSGMLRRPFRKGDPRLEVTLKEPEPLVHFALVCGATSCPPIRTYSTIVSCSVNL